MERGDILYEGKAKKIYEIPSDKSVIWVEFKNSLTAFNGEKKADLPEKGKLNCLITANIFNFLKSNGVDSHFEKLVDDTNMICKKVEIIPLEVVVRNVLAGSTAKKLGIEEGKRLEKPLVEFYYKDDNLGDPFVSDDQALLMNAARNEEELKILKDKALIVNRHLVGFFEKMGIQLVDFKLEFGRDQNDEVLLADEITPDTCRLWDVKTGERLDKDRFRRDLGGVVEAYQEVLNRMKIKIS